MPDIIPSIFSGSRRQWATGGAFTAANRTSRELATWRPPIQSADADVIPHRDLIESRAIDVLRNNGNIAAGAAFHRDAVVGSQLILNARPDIVALGLDEEWASSFQEEVESKFHLWAESPRNWIDAARRNTFTSMMRMICGVYIYGGEILITSEWIDRARERFRPARTCFQMIELSRLSDPMIGSAITRNRRIRGGVEIDSYGQPIAYHIRRMPPGDLISPYGSTNLQLQHQWSRIRAETAFGRPNVIHVMEQTRPGQTRGISQLVAGLKEMRITRKFRDVTLQNAAVNASFAASIESELPSAEIYQMIGGADAKKVLNDYVENFSSAVEDYVGEGRAYEVDGAKIPHLFPGTKLNLHPMGHPGGIGTEFEESLLRHTAALLDLSYEELSRDYSETNYSSARAAGAVTQRAMKARKRMIVDRVATIMYRNWLEEMINLGEISTMMGQRVPNFYENEAAFTRCSWIGGARGQIDEMKETEAANSRVAGGLSTHEAEIAALGGDWRETYAQLAREQAERERLGLTLTETERAVTVAEQTVTNPDDENNEDDQRGNPASN